VQIALAVAILPSAAEMTWGYLRSGMRDPGFPVSEYSTARLALGDPAARDAADGGGAVGARFAELQRELARRLGDEGVSAVTFSTAIPGAEPTAEIGVEAVAADGERRFDAHYEVGVNRIDAAFLDTLGARILIGRRFEAADLRAESDAVIVNQTFAREVFGDANPLGLRIRYVEQPTQLERWHEIVGVSTDVPGNDERPRMYHPLEPGQLASVTMTLRMRADRAGAAERLRELATRIDPRLGIDEYAT